MRLRNSNLVRLVIVGVTAATISVTACAPEPAPGGPGWTPAGCIPGNQSGGTMHPDIRFSGTPNLRGNGILTGNWSNGQFVVSADGSCSGAAFAAMTIVQAADQSAANSLCATLNAGTATSTAGSGYNLPADAWACSETYYL